MQVASPAGDHEAAQSAGYLDSVGGFAIFLTTVAYVVGKRSVYFVPQFARDLALAPFRSRYRNYLPIVCCFQLQSHTLMLMTDTPINPKNRIRLIGLEVFGGMVCTTLRRMKGGNGPASRAICRVIAAFAPAIYPVCAQRM